MTSANLSPELPPPSERAIPIETSTTALQANSVKGGAGKGDSKLSKPALRHDSGRETVESIVVAFVLAFLFRAFEAEAFVIPTGSMAPTLYGQHRDVYCSQCGTRAAVTASEEILPDGTLSPEDRAEISICPNCRFPNRILRDQIFKGDRILVNKFPYEFSTPERWDVVVFKYPEEAKVNYIKRLVGLPGEELRIEWGDIHVRPSGTQEPFRIPRKKPEKQRKLQLLVYDNDSPAQAMLDAGWPERWDPEKGAVWSSDPKAHSFRIDPEPGEGDKQHWLRYRHYVPTSEEWTRALQKQALGTPPRPQLITDFYAYNAKATVEEVRGVQGDVLPDIGANAIGMQWVGDLTVSCTVDVLAAEGEVTWELVEGGRRYQCRVDLRTGTASLSYITVDPGHPEQEETVKLVDAETPLNSLGEHTVSFANVDERLCFWVDERLVSSVEFDPGSRYVPQPPPIAPTDRDLAPVGIAAQGAKVRVSHLLVERDIYYRYAYAPTPSEDEYNAPKNIEELRNLLSDPQSWYAKYDATRKSAHYDLKDFADDQEDQFFVLGDNSPRSKDSRLWNAPTVPRRLMIGKAFFIYWPHGIPFLNDGKGYPIAFYNVRSGQRDKNGREILKKAEPPCPSFSIPFYPQVGRMKRIR